jgi:CubicO group peptidase (beta-lactamase class C family)
MLAPILVSFSLLVAPTGECPPGLALDLALFPPAEARGVAPAAEPAFTATGLEVPELAWVDTLLRSYMEGTEVSRAAVAITKGDRLVFARGYTYADAGTRPTEPTTTFRIASCSKPITSLALHRLFERGEVAPSTHPAERLDLTTRPGSFRDPRLDAIVVDDLLTHSGGWDRDAAGDPIAKDGQISQDLGVPLPISKHDVRIWMNGQRLQSSPGDRYAYSNYGVALLGQTIEKATGLPFPEAIRTLVFEPLGLSRPRVGHSHEEDLFPGEAGYDDRHAYDIVNIEAWDSAGGWIAAAPDWARLFSVLRPGGAGGFLAPESVAAMLDERFPFGEMGVARGWFRWTTPDGATAFGHGGSLPGTSTSAYWRRDDDVGIVIFLNKSVGSFPVIHQRIASQAAWPTHDLWASVGIGAGAPSRAVAEEWIATATRSPGAEGSDWKTDLVVANRTPLANEVRLDWGGRSTLLELAPNECRGSIDVVGLLGGEGTAPLRIRAAEPITAVSRTYSTDATGTFGQPLDGENPFEELWRGDRAFLPALREDPFVRTNLGFLNAGGRPALVALTFLDSDGSERLSREIEVPPRELVALHRPMESLAPIAAASARLELLAGEWVSAYASVVDNRTNDPTTIPFLRPSGGGRLVVPVVARADGDRGSRWRSNLVLLNPGASTASAVVRVLGRDLPPRAVDLAPSAEVVLDDVLGLFLESGVASLEVESSVPLVATSRTWNEGPEGTFGQSIPVLDPAMLLGTGESAIVPGVRVDGSYRTNLFVANFGAVPARLLVTLRDAAGNETGRAELLLEPTGLRNLGAAALAGGAELPVASGRVEVLEGSGVAAWGSLIDNRTNDPATLPMRR